MAELEYSEIEVIEEPSKTYRLDQMNQKMIGKIDELEAIKQAIFLRLSVEKNEHLIYGEDYGIELEDLFGEPESYVIPELQRRIIEELLKDDRILNVSEFSFESSKDSVVAYFTVYTVLGDIEEEMEVGI